jgi:hypothetical protein
LLQIQAASGSAGLGEFGEPGEVEKVTISLAGIGTYFFVNTLQPLLDSDDLDASERTEIYTIATLLPST